MSYIVVVLLVVAFIVRCLFFCSVLFSFEHFVQYCSKLLLLC